MEKPGDGAESTTRRFNTTRGELTYAELADEIAPFLEDLLDRIVDGEYSRRDFDEELVLEFHRDILGELIPDIAGVWRTEPVQVGNHFPPDYWEIRARMRDFVQNVSVRVASAISLELQIETLAYAEGELLHVHPFADFNGRANRAVLLELMMRMDFPPVEVAVERGSEMFRRYKNALADYDNGRLGSLGERSLRGRGARVRWRDQRLLSVRHEGTTMSRCRVEHRRSRARSSPS